MALKLAAKHHARAIAITRGTKGAVFLDTKKRKFYNVPALSTIVVDRIGAGDSFLSLASLCLAAKLEPEMTAFAASAIAALDVQIVCNREPVKPINLFKYITTLLK